MGSDTVLTPVVTSTCRRTNESGPALHSHELCEGEGGPMLRTLWLRRAEELVGPVGLEPTTKGL